MREKQYLIHIKIEFANRTLDQITPGATTGIHLFLVRLSNLQIASEINNGLHIKHLEFLAEKFLGEHT